MGKVMFGLSVSLDGFIADKMMTYQKSSPGFQAPGTASMKSRAIRSTRTVL